jgi:hypothetical protein
MMNMDGFVVYDVATGAERWRGRGVAGDQMLSAGLAALTVPLLALGEDKVNLDIVKLAYCAGVDAEAEAKRLMFITPGYGQSMTYLYKAEEVRRWLADNTAETPFLTAEAEGLGIPLADLVAEVKGRIDAWTVIGSAINAAQRCAKMKINEAATIGAIAAAPPADWDAVIAAASASIAPPPQPAAA